MHTGASVNTERAEPCSAHALSGLPQGGNREAKGSLQPIALGPRLWAGRRDLPSFAPNTWSSKMEQGDCFSFKPQLEEMDG